MEVEERRKFIKEDRKTYRSFTIGSSKSMQRRRIPPDHIRPNVYTSVIV